MNQMVQEIHYERLKPGVGQREPLSKPWFSRSTLILTSSLFATTSTVCLFIILHFWSQSQWHSCIPSPYEAQAQGCKFDLMMGAWVRPECYDEELSEDFLSKSTWHYYLNSAATNEMAERVARLGQHEHLYADSEFHAAHCTYLIQKLSRAFATNRGVDSHSWNPETIVHCSNLILNFGINGFVSSPNGTSLRTSFPACRIAS